MGYIYCIENLINHKKYIGKTLFSVEARWKKHIWDSHRVNIQHRPLYLALNKYGINAFQVSTIEKCDNNIINEREKHWISVFDTYNNGYNATLGGDGTQLYNIQEDVMWNLFTQHKTPKEMAQYFGCSTDTITLYAKEYGINLRGNTQRHDIYCYYQDELISHFYSAGQASQWLINEGLSNAKLETLRTNIMRCCKGIRKTCCGFHWSFKQLDQ